eukprot:TRINITY_DN492_c0_g1_i2.p1 TRINITY_DN492_c0_g1~~TRINITY_DN492_c0_g1_i2.p1  ORF type:complete len:1075 (-),score=293.32 TRINITY_DN492_c0_g1_i2:973-4197(-)
MLRNGDRPLFDLIIIINDRLHLDVQLGDSAVKFLTSNSITEYVRPTTSKKLEDALREASAAAVLNGKRTTRKVHPHVIITTLQKFCHVRAGDVLRDQRGVRMVALIGDEAHRSHGSSSTRHLHELLTGVSQQALEKIAYFSFTSTPNAKTLEMFGQPCPTSRNLLVPFHVYSFKSALSDGTIVDVLKNYTSVSSFAQLRAESKDTAIEGDAAQQIKQGKKAAMALVKETWGHEVIIRKKSKFIIDHFVGVATRLDTPEFRVLGMLVTKSRKHVLFYLQALREFVAALPKEKQFGIIGAFSPFDYEKKSYNESDTGVNGEYARYCSVRYGIVEALKQTSLNIRLIVVADKLQTGFDEPRLAAMYVDKQLHKSNAVQTLGRLDRSAKGKTEVFVVDFVNKPSEIYNAFSIYWGETALKYCKQRQQLEAHFQVVTERLRWVRGILEQDFETALASVLAEDDICAKAGNPLRSDDLSAFLYLCDRLQLNDSCGVKYPFVLKLRKAIFDRKKKDAESTITGLLGIAQVNFQPLTALCGSVSLNSCKDRFVIPNVAQMRKGNKDMAMTQQQVLELANSIVQPECTPIVGDNTLQEPPSPPHVSLEFAEKVWAVSDAEKQGIVSKVQEQLNSLKQREQQRKTNVEDAVADADTDECADAGTEELGQPHPAKKRRLRPKPTPENVSRALASSSPPHRQLSALLMLNANFQRREQTIKEFVREFIEKSGLDNLFGIAGRFMADSPSIEPAVPAPPHPSPSMLASQALTAVYNVARTAEAAFRDAVGPSRLARTQLVSALLSTAAASHDPSSQHLLAPACKALTAICAGNAPCCAEACAEGVVALLVAKVSELDSDLSASVLQALVVLLAEEACSAAALQLGVVSKVVPHLFSRDPRCTTNSLRVLAVLASQGGAALEYLQNDVEVRSRLTALVSASAVATSTCAELLLKLLSGQKATLPPAPLQQQAPLQPQPQHPPARSGHRSRSPSPPVAPNIASPMPAVAAVAPAPAPAPAVPVTAPTVAADAVVSSSGVPKPRRPLALLAQSRLPPVVRAVNRGVQRFQPRLPPPDEPPAASGEGGSDA